MTDLWNTTHLLSDLQPPAILATLHVWQGQSLMFLFGLVGLLHLGRLRLLGVWVAFCGLCSVMWENRPDWQFWTFVPFTLLLDGWVAVVESLGMRPPRSIRASLVLACYSFLLLLRLAAGLVQHNNTTTQQHFPTQLFVVSIEINLNVAAALIGILKAFGALGACIAVLLEQWLWGILAVIRDALHFPFISLALATFVYITP